MADLLLLASTSTYKQALLARLKIPFSCIHPGVDETPLPGEAPVQLALRLAREKALAGTRSEISTKSAIVIGADQVAVCAGQVLGKPGTVEHAREQLIISSGKRVHFHTAVALARNGQLIASSSVDTVVHLRELTREEIDTYIHLDMPLDCAGSFRWESLGIALFRESRSEDPSALQGLPLIALCSMLRKAGIDPLKKD